MKISIITVVFNNIDTIEHCIKSVANQTYEKIEYIIIDGGSTDGTVAAIRKYESKISKFISEHDNGIYHAMNKGIALATGDAVGFLNADDFYADNGAVQTIVDTIKNNNADSCYGDVVYVKKENISKVTRYWKSGFFSRKKIEKGWFPPHPTFFVKKVMYENYGSFDTKFKYSADVELMTRFLCKYQISTYYIPEILIKMRDSGRSNKKMINIAKSVWECYLAMRENEIKVTPLYVLSTLMFRLRQVFVK